MAVIGLGRSIPAHLKPPLNCHSTPFATYKNTSLRLRMGIKGLIKLITTHAPKSIKEEKKLEAYSGKRIAIDVSISIYQFLLVVGRDGHGMLTNQFGQVTSHLQGMFYRTTKFLEAGMMPVYVFDGEPPDIKKDLVKRFSRREEASDNLVQAIKIGEKADISKYSKQIVKVTEQHNEDCKKLLTLMGVPVVQVLEELKLTMDQFVDMCILCGCDYCDNIGGIGPQKSLKLIREHGSIEMILETIDKDRFQIPVHWPYLQARCLFKEPKITPLEYQPKLEWSSPDEEGLKKFLVDENGFNYERVKKVIGKIKSVKSK